MTQTARSLYALSLSGSLTLSARSQLATRSLAFQFATWLGSFVSRGFCNLAARSARRCVDVAPSLRVLSEPERTLVVSLARQRRAQ